MTPRARTRRPDYDPKVCATLRSLGYSVSKRIRLYGEELQATSDPFPAEGGFAIRVRSRNSPEDERTVQIPLSVVEVARHAA